ncbi:helix-turn-helix domain-containing protein [Nostoc sp. 2RC]|uniref:helix-turn-helix domain-containing protein n=1 Tax=Nostoc sp. 2RC TaxID=2485484 RepID=UPI0016280007|nr:helix-turn-helix domain-containing protein [Nostoc sp. 2RC]MBC1236840.1 helix-turn-helix domain-containing protein [Nostoc sp. 2RC]
MSRHNILSESVMSPEQEAQSIKKLERTLKIEGSQTKLIGANKEEISIPYSVYQVLRQAVDAMALGKVVSIVIQDRELTTQKAADFLKVSRPHLIKLLEQGEIPHIMVGTHRRVRFEDLVKYKQQRDVKRDQLLTELTQMSQEAGFYE